MASAERTQELLKGLQEAIIEFDEDKTRELAETAIRRAWTHFWLPWTVWPKE